MAIDSTKIQLIEQFLKELNLNYQKSQREDGLCNFFLRFRTENNLYEGNLLINSEQKWIGFRTIIPNKISDSDKIKIAEFIVRLNNLYIFGSFGMNFSDGEVYFQTFSDDALIPTLTKEYFNNMISVNLRAAEKGLYGIYKIIYGNLSPKDAIESLDTQ